MGKFIKENTRKNLIDRLYLLIAAILVGLGLMGLIFFLEDYLALSKKWEFFVLGSLMYALITTYGAYKYNLFRKSHVRSSRFVKVAVITGSTIVVTFVLFYFNVLPLPDSLWPYTLGATVLGPATIVYVKYSSQKKHLPFC